MCPTQRAGLGISLDTDVSAGHKYVLPKGLVWVSDAEKPHLQGHRGKSQLAKEKTIDNTSGPVVYMPLLMSVSPGISVKST